MADIGSTFRIDCHSVVEAVHRGLAWATSAARPLARVFNLLLPAVDDKPPQAFVWMPAHTLAASVGVAALGDGSRLTAVDRSANQGADLGAKLAVEAHRVALPIRRAYKAHDAKVTALAKWVGKVTYHANHRPREPHRDSEASRAAAAKAARRRAALRDQRPARRCPVLRPVSHGGHHLVFADGKWVCAMCRRCSSKWTVLAPQRCSGSAAVQWAKSAAAIAERGGREGRSPPDAVCWRCLVQ